MGNGKKIRIGIVGYGNLGRGAALAVQQAPDMELVGVFTRRSPKVISDNKLIAFHSVSDIMNFKDVIDVLLLCGGSATDLPEQGPRFAQYFNTVDSFDTHAKIPEYFDAVDLAAKRGGNVGVISVGWDPGLFSINRLFAESILPKGETYTFWGDGVSQGHSDALRKLPGVLNAVQYTVPYEEALVRVRSGSNPSLTTREKHKRVCYVVADQSTNKIELTQKIQDMPYYFSDYETTVHFISEQELTTKHSGMPHGGFVIRSGETSLNTKQIYEFSLDLGSNPEFTSSVLVAYARAAHRLNQEQQFGAKSVLDIAPSYLSPKIGAELRKELL